MVIIKQIDSEISTIFPLQVIDIFSKLCYIIGMIYKDEAAIFNLIVSKLAGLKGAIIRSLNNGGQDYGLPNQGKDL